MRDKTLSTVERNFAIACIAVKTRLDGRRPTEPRQISLNLGPTFGTCEIAFDKTQVHASTAIEAIPPPSDRPSEGILTIATEFSPTASVPAARDALHRAPTATLLTETRNCIEKFVREARALDTDALCILSGVKVWSVRVNVDIVNDDGNCVDACVLAVLASLLHARRPDVTVTGKEVRVHSVDEREPVPLPVHHVPLSVSFALFGAGKPHERDSVVLDPVKKEELSSGGSLSFSYNAQGEVCGVYKAGGLPLNYDTFLQCSDLGQRRALELTSLLKKALADAASQHPLATVRPMLVYPEPVAQVRGVRRTEDIGRDAVMSTWNATPVDDVAPPPRLDSQPVKMNEVVDVDEVVETIFEKKDVGQMDVNKVREVQKKAVVESIVISDDDEESSDDDLQSAIISRPRGGGGRR